MNPAIPLSESQALHRRAIEALEGSRLAEAAGHLRAAVEMASERASLWNDLGVVLEALGHAGEALRCYRTALDRDPEHVEAKENYGLLRRQMARWRAAQKVMSTTLGVRGAPGVSAAAKCRVAAAS